MNVDCRWSLPPTELALTRDEIHIWSASLDQVDQRVNELSRILSANETARAERFYSECDRRRFVVGRAALRIILARYLNGESHQVQFSYNRHGKPALKQEVGQPELAHELRFNLAHSHEIALYAFTRGRAIGIDIEYVRPLPDAGELAARFFAPREYEALCKLAEKLQPVAFFSCWTRKEAYVKAIGDGLSWPLDKFAVSLAPGEPAQLLYVEGDPKEVDRWSLAGFTPASGYVAAVAVEEPGGQVSCWRWL